MAKEQEPCKKLLDEFIFIVNEILFNVQEEIKYTKRSNQKITLFNRLDTLSDALEVKIWNYIQKSRFKDYYYKEEKIFSGQVLINIRIGQDSFLDRFLYNGRFYELNSSSKCNGIHINNLFKFFVWCEVSKSFTRSII